jgi:hypothetical protein
VPLPLVSNSKYVKTLGVALTAKIAVVATPATDI